MMTYPMLTFVPSVVGTIYRWPTVRYCTVQYFSIFLFCRHLSHTRNAQGSSPKKQSGNVPKKDLFLQINGAYGGGVPRLRH